MHLISLPIVVCAAVDIDSDEKSGTVVFGLWYIPLVKKKIDVPRVMRELLGADGEQKVVGDVEEKKPKQSRRYLLRLGKNLLSVINVRVLDLRARIGLGDAAATAISVGAFRVAVYNAYNVLGYRRGVADISADYDAETLCVGFVGIISLCIADIIYAAVKALFARSKGKGRSRRRYANTVTE